MIEKTIELWHHDVMSGKRPETLDELLHDDVVFYSPVVFTPQEGKAVTKLYLGAAGATFSGGKSKKNGESKGTFQYTKKVIAGDTAVLEFETKMDGKYVNGVDIITCDDDGKIIEFKVMIRPLQAINAVHAMMGAMLKKMQPEAGASQ